MKRVRCAIYTRKSTEEGLDQDFNSLAAQRTACEAYIKSQAGEGWRAVAQTYDDGGYSGGTMERPALRALLSDIDDGTVDVVVVYKVDRLTRALTDFARIVDRFDAKGASFVSVTQSFNTSTSMGRLTLNVLLSFAQFERELTSERIRDKIAASKRKGMWMGGAVPLGYTPDGRTLAPIPEEAQRVRRIFARYLEIGSLARLCDALDAEGVTSKKTITKKGREIGGKRLWPGALRHLLTNRLYRGEIRHGANWYPGLHPAIVDADQFDAVQEKLANSGGSAGQRFRASGAPLKGLVFDDVGHPMSPHHAQKEDRRHHYYVSLAVMRSRTTAPGSLARISAGVLENCVADVCARVLEASLDWPTLIPRIRRVTVSLQQLVIDLDAAGVDPLLASARLGRDETISFDGAVARLTIPFHHRPWRGSARAFDRAGRPALTRDLDLSLAQAIARAWAWRKDWTSEGGPSFTTLAAREDADLSYVLRLARLAYLAPDLIRGALAGTAMASLTVERVVRADLPFGWDQQRQLFLPAQ